MQANNFAAIISSIVTVVREIKAAYNLIPVNIALPFNKRKLIDLNDKILELENKINVGFPQLAQLVRSYSNLISDVKIARALSDKMAEIYGLVPGLGKFTGMFANNLQGDYSRISANLSRLPYVNNVEKGQIDRILINIRDDILELKRVNVDEIDKIREILENISTQYADMEAILARLLEIILSSLDISNES